MKPTAREIITDLEFDRYLTNLRQEIRDVYLSDSRPWVIGFSGGKDSTATLQLIWSSLQGLPKENLTKEIFVISSDTFVETPVIVNHIDNTYGLLNESAIKQNLPFRALKVTPEVNNTFWVNLIGRGYPAPYNRFRWCTDRLKIEPANKFITEQVAKYGEVLVVLGARFAESATRSGSMSKRRIVGNKLTRHSSLANAWVYTPIEEWQTLEVWEYLLSYPSPWGYNNEDLKQLYQDAQDGDCPLVVDKTTPSCGNSRFGCWTCTVVDKDTSMESMINSGEEWLRPLLEFRNWLSETNDPSQKENIRSVRRRNGRVQFKETETGEKKLIWGPFTLEFRKTILRKLLATQRAIQRSKKGTNIDLITYEELLQIRKLWLFEEGDWKDSIPQIFKDETGQELEVLENDWAGMGGLEHEILEDICKYHEVPVELLMELFDTERRQFGMSRRSTIFNDIDKILKKDWQSKEEVLAQVRNNTELNNISG